MRGGRILLLVKDCQNQTNQKHFTHTMERPARYSAHQIYMKKALIYVHQPSDLFRTVDQYRQCDARKWLKKDNIGF